MHINKCYDKKMELVTHNQEQIQQAIEDGKVQTRDLSSIMEDVIKSLVPQQLLKTMILKADPELIDNYVLVEKVFDPIPWIDPQHVLVIDIPSRIVFDKKVQWSETNRLKKLGFPSEEIPDLIQAHIQSDKSKREEIESTAGQVYKRPENFIFAWTKPEGQKGVLVTQMDRVDLSIYSIATSLPLSLPLVKQYHYFKTVLMYLLREVPLNMKITSLRYAHHTTQGNKLHFFISIK